MKLFYIVKYIFCVMFWIEKEDVGVNSEPEGSLRLAPVSSERDTNILRHYFDVSSLPSQSSSSPSRLTP